MLPFAVWDMSVMFVYTELCKEATGMARKGRWWDMNLWWYIHKQRESRMDGDGVMKLVELVAKFVVNETTSPV